MPIPPVRDGEHALSPDTVRRPGCRTGWRPGRSASHGTGTDAGGIVRLADCPVAVAAGADGHGVRRNYRRTARTIHRAVHAGRTALGRCAGCGRPWFPRYRVGIFRRLLHGIGPSSAPAGLRAVRGKGRPMARTAEGIDDCECRRRLCAGDIHHRRECGKCRQGRFEHKTSG